MRWWRSWATSSADTVERQRAIAHYRHPGIVDARTLPIMTDIPEPAVPKLADARQRIDAIDRELQALIAERARWAQQVGRAKGPLKAAIDYYRPGRCT